MEIKTYIAPLLKYWWLLLLATILATGSSYYVTRQQPPIYQANSTLIIGRTVYDPNPNSSEFFLNQQLSNFYADLANRDAVRNATMEALNVNWLPQYVAQSNPDSQLIEIVVTDSIPERAQIVANELANQLIKLSPGNPDSDDQERADFIKDQLASLQETITKTQDEINQKQLDLEDETSAREFASIQQEIVLLDSKLTSLRTIYSSLLANTSEGASNTLSIIEEASLPRSPIGPNNGVIILLSAAVAFLIAAAAGYLLEYLDDTLKTPEEITKILDLPIIGYLSEMGKGMGEGVYVSKQPRSVIAESYRSLRTNLEFVEVDEPIKLLYITSPGMSEGKTSVATNLAVVMAQGGKRVALVDTDLRRPNVHRQLELTNRRGLSDVFLGQADLQDVIHIWGKEKILIVTGGSPPPNPTDLLGSKRMDAILEEVGQMVDVVIIDGPPFVVADAAVMASKVDGVLLVIRYGYTRKASATATREQLKRGGARVIGVAINRMPKALEDHYGRYRYYYSYYGVYGSDDGSGQERADGNQSRRSNIIKRARKSIGR